MSSQLPLDITLRDEATLERFVVGNNQELVDLLLNFEPVKQPRMIQLTGIEGCGKTHLLQAVCRRIEHAIYLPLAVIPRLSQDIFEGLAQRPLVCLDDIQVLAGNAELELALFTLINDLKEHNRSFIYSTQQPVDFTLKDLHSRLSGCEHYPMESPEESHKKEYLSVEARRRGLQMSEDVVRWVLTHTSRDMSSLIALMQQLDRESLRSQRRLTVPFVKQVVEQ